MSEKKKVLVICRSSMGQMYLGVVLRRIWFTPILARTAGEGVLLTQENPCSLVLFDGDMPDGERTAAIAALSGEPSLRALPWVMLSTEGANPRPEALLPEGWAAVVRKPIEDVSLFYDVLRRLTEDPRQTARVPVRMRVEILEPAPQRFLTSVNISEGGIYLNTHAPLPEDTTVQLAFTLPQDAEQIRVAGIVVRTVPLVGRLESEPGMGIQFIDHSADTKNRIKNYVQWSLIGDLEWESALESF